MASQHYKKLIDELCKLVPMPAVQSLYERLDLEVEKFFFSLIEAGSAGVSQPGTPASDKQDSVIMAFCDFGPLPRHQREAVMQRLLELNLSLHGEPRATMSMNRENGHVLACHRLPLGGMTAPALLKHLRDHAAQARQWRDGGCFLEDAQATPGRRSGSVRHQLMRLAGTA